MSAFWLLDQVSSRMPEVIRPFDHPEHRVISSIGGRRASTDDNVPHDSRAHALTAATATTSPESCGGQLAIQPVKAHSPIAMNSDRADMLGKRMGRLVLRALLSGIVLAAVAALLYSTLGANLLSAVLFTIACGLTGGLPRRPL